MAGNSTLGMINWDRRGGTIKLKTKELHPFIIAITRVITHYHVETSSTGWMTSPAVSLDMLLAGHASAFCLPAC